MTKAMDNFDPSSNMDGDLKKALINIKSKLLVIGFKTDWLFPPKKGKEIQLAAMEAGIKSSFVVLDGKHGHDSFLFMSDRYFKIIRSFIES
jgi:homoserine O-acetyltransferase